MNEKKKMNPSKEARDFLSRHNVRVLDTNKRAVKSYGVNVNYFTSPYDYNKIEKTLVGYETEPLYTVEISESELERVAKFEDQVFNNMAQKGHFNLFETLMEQKEKEQFLKEKYPAVKKAYEQYSLMLKMAETGEMNS